MTIFTGFLHNIITVFLTEKALERDNFMDADTAKEWGLIDKILQTPPMPGETPQEE